MHFLLRAVAWLDDQGISRKRALSDNGSPALQALAKTCKALGLTQKRTRPYSPRTNRKTERIIKTLNGMSLFDGLSRLSRKGQLATALFGELLLTQPAHGTAL